MASASQSLNLLSFSFAGRIPVPDAECCSLLLFPATFGASSRFAALSESVYLIQTKSIGCPRSRALSFLLVFL